MKARIYIATRIEDDARVYIVGKQNGDDMVWVCETLADARREMGRADFAADYDISETIVE